VGIWHPKHECNQGTLWRSAYAFGASFIFTVGPRFAKQPGDTPRAWKHVPVFRFTDLEDLKQHLPYDCPLVGVELDPGAVTLQEFKHPERACYLLGAEDHGLSPGVRRACHRLVYVPGASICLNVAVVGSILMYDRARRLM
jgi:tRNA G18 (ribose-2'-O)-methylase SpoU